MASYMVHKDKLNGEYLKLFEQAEFYGISNYIPDGEFEEGMSSLLDVLCEAQYEGRALADVVGTDAEGFCRSFFENPSPITNMILNIPKYIFRMSVLVLIFNICDIVMAATEGKDILSVDSDMAPFIIGGFAGNIFGIIAVSVLRKIMFRLKKITFNVCSVIAVVLSLTLCFGCIYFIEEYCSVEIAAVWTAVICALYIIGYKAFIWRRRYIACGSIRRTDEEKERTFRGIMKDIVEESGAIEDELLKTFEKKYNRINRRRVKKGLDEMTYAEFHAKFVRENNFLKKEHIYMAVFYAAIVIAGTLFVMSASGIADALLFGVVLTIVEAFIWRGIYGIQKRTLGRRLDMEEECEQKNITIMALVNEHKKDG